MKYQLKLASMGMALAMGAISMVPAAATANAGGLYNRDRVVVVEHRARRDFREGRGLKRWMRSERRRFRRAQRRNTSRYNRHHAPVPQYYAKKKRVGPGAVALGIGAVILGLIIADTAHDHHR